MSAYLIATFTIIVFAISVVYLLIFTKKQLMYIRYWGFAWMAYCFSLFCLIIYSTTSIEFFLELRKLWDMANILLILFASYSLIHTKTPTYWYRFSIYMILLAIICAIYKLDLLSYYLPLSLFQVIAAAFAGYNLVYKWAADSYYKICSGIVVVSWGIFKSLSPIMELFQGEITTQSYVIELMFSNILNISTLILFIINLQNENKFSDNLYKYIVENSKEVIFYYQLKPFLAYKYITESIKDMTGYSASEFYSQPRLMLNLVSLDNLGAAKEIFNPDNTHERTYSIKMLNKDKEEYWAEFTRSIIKDESGNVTAILCIMRDITEMQTTQMEQININNSRNMLLSYISHELRTPITSIAGYLTAINDGVITGEEEVNEAYDIITHKTLTLKTLIDDLDQLSKLESNKFNFEFMLTNVEELTSQLVTAHYADATSVHHFEVEVEADMSHLRKYWVVIDSVRINQIFANLVNNAYKYAQDSNRMKWTFEIDEQQENLHVSIRDYGKGIQSKHLSHIFEKFYRADYADNEHRQIEGRGLGLTLCKEMIQAHQGDIFVESEDGKGCLFTFIIPLYKED